MGQYGYVTAADARTLGIPMVELGKLAARGQIHHVAYGLYRFDDLPPTRYGAQRPRGMTSRGRSAATWYRLG